MRAGRKWSAHIWHQGKQLYLGVFIREIDAAKAYETALKEITLKETA
jgi:hypothetical protein